MTPPVWLIAEREFRAYTSTLTFWVALAIGPVLAGLAMAAAALSVGAVTNVSVRSDDARAAQVAQAAVAEAAALESHKLAFSAATPGDDALAIERRPDGGLTLHFSARFPLSAEGRLLVARTMAASLAAGGSAPQVALAAAAPAPAADPRALARFGLVMILWLTLTGSLGMLLQAVVRERANRALEGLLAAARPIEIVTGKLLGVGAVSALVLAAWLGCGALSAAVSGARVATLRPALAEFADPLALARAAGLYALAFGFYGFLTVALGAAARDTASAQNLSRPLFGVLLVVFFVSLAGASGAGAWIAWLAYLPPFTPFVLLLEPPGPLSPLSQALAVALLLAATAAAARLAVGQLRMSEGRR